MTVTKLNDKHGYYSAQSWNADMTKIVWSSVPPQARRRSIWVMDADGSSFRKLADGVPYNMHTGSNAYWSRDGKSIYYGQAEGVDLQGRKVKRPLEDEPSSTSRRPFNCRPKPIAAEPPGTGVLTTCSAR